MGHRSYFFLTKFDIPSFFASSGGRVKGADGTMVTDMFRLETCSISCHGYDSRFRQYPRSLGLPLVDL